jgi:quercetin dioxygenase-like cupin family protein
MHRTKAAAALTLAAAALLATAALTLASPPSGVTPTVLARGTYPAFEVQSNPDGPAGKFKASSKTPIDVVVRRHEYAPGGSTGWHAHPYPVFITVISGEVTFYERDDPTCSPHVVHAGEGYVDDGVGHIGINRTSQPAVDVSVIMAPVGGAFRTELDAPGPYCGF